MPSFFDCSICGKKTVAFRGSISLRVGKCFVCWEKTERVVWVSPYGKSSISKAEYDKNPQKHDEIHKDSVRQ